MGCISIATTSMETVVFDQTPLAEYLRDEGQDEPSDWVPAASGAPSSSAATAAGVATSNDATATPVTPFQQQLHHRKLSHEQQSGISTPPPSPPSPSFAPMGRPMVRKRFRDKPPSPIRVDVAPRSRSLSASINNGYSKAVASTFNRADNNQFIEQFRYTIITSNLLGSSVLGQRLSVPPQSSGATQQPSGTPVAKVPATLGLAGAVTGGLVLIWAITRACTGRTPVPSASQLFFVIVLVAAAAVAAQIYDKQQRLRHTRTSVLAEVRTFVTRSQDFDGAAGAAIAFIKEVELVSRGYRISTPLPPISRMDDKSQTRRCMRLRTAIRAFFAEALPKYTDAAKLMQGFAGQVDLEMYHHVYDISDLDVSDALLGFTEAEFDDANSIRTLTVVGARFHTIRKMFLCALLALEANSGEEADCVRWTAAAKALHALNETTETCHKRLRDILSESETFPQISTPKVPLSPGRERWRSQLGKLNSLSTGIRGLQAKLALLREESDRTLNEADDITQLGPNLMAQYEAIGQDLKMLTQAWEEGRSALASGIDRNEKRLSSLSNITMLSPTVSLSGLTTVDEDALINSSGTSSKRHSGGISDALQALNGGGMTPPASIGEPEEVVFEAVSLPPAIRLKSVLSREERIAKMKEERERRAEARERSDASRGMLRELEMVINLRPKAGQNENATTPSKSKPLSLAVPPLQPLSS